MRKNSQSGNVLIILAVVVVLAIGGYLLYSKLQSGSAPSTAKVTPVNLEEGKKLAPAQVTINSGGFTPSTIEVKAGQGLTFINDDSVAHTLSSDAKNPADSLSEIDPIQSKEQMTLSFSAAATIHISDTSNSNLKLTVIVK